MGLGVGESQPSHLICSRKFYKRNALDPQKDIHVFEMYEPSTWAELNWMDDFGLCASKKEAWQLVEKGETTLSGRIPINPSGGVVSCNPIGATAMIRVAEAALQVRGDGGERQVTREVTNAVATSFGGSYWTIMHLLTRSLD
jgi:acetyl-CoA C-acetyltransferase